VNEDMIVRLAVRFPAYRPEERENSCTNDTQFSNIEDIGHQQQDETKEFLSLSLSPSLDVENGYDPKTWFNGNPSRVA
jgi:hypothetical protein